MAVARRKSSWFGRRRTRSPESAATEAYRRLAAQLNHDLGGPEGEGAAILVPCPDERAVVDDAVRLLAAYLAEEQAQRVLIVDGASESSTLHEDYQIPRAPGLRNILVNGHDRAMDGVHATGHPAISLMPTGVAEQGTRGFEASTLAERFAQLRRVFGFILGSAPPVLGDATGLAFPSLMDCVLLFAIDGQTRGFDIAECRVAIERCQAKRIEPILVKP